MSSVTAGAMAEPASGGAASSSAAPSLSTATVSLPFIHWVCGVDPATLQAAIASLATVEAAAAPLAAALTAAYASVLDLTEQQAAFRLETLREVINAPTTSAMASLYGPVRDARAAACSECLRCSYSCVDVPRLQATADACPSLTSPQCWTWTHICWTRGFPACSRLRRLRRRCEGTRQTHARGRIAARQIALDICERCS